MFALNMLASTAAETIVNQALKADLDAPLLLAPLQGSSLLVEITDWRMTGLVFIADGRVYIRLNSDTKADATLQATLPQLLAFSKAIHAPAALQRHQIKVQGDLGVLERWQTVFAQLHLDLESLLASLCGDSLAHAVNQPIQKVLHWHRKHCASTCQDLTEALQEEKRLLVGREEVEDFYQDLAQFRQDLARCEAKMTRISA